MVNGSVVKMPTHKRIRMFNTRDTYPNQALDNDLCQAVVAGKLKRGQFTLSQSSRYTQDKRSASN